MEDLVLLVQMPFLDVSLAMLLAICHVSIPRLHPEKAALTSPGSLVLAKFVQPPTISFYGLDKDL